ncbi:MAG: glycosyltransferase family 4 protein [Hyphomicrobiales bacterium]
MSRKAAGTSRSDRGTPLKIAFYAPLKPHDHPVPSGDRLMARQLLSCMELRGHTPVVASTLRTFLAEPDAEALERQRQEGDDEARRLITAWESSGDVPDLWFSYHNYYKAVDFIGPAVARRFDIPYVIAEGSYAPKRDRDDWAPHQAAALAGLEQASLHLCFTERDRKGLAQVTAAEKLADFPPFVDVEPNRQHRGRNAVPVLVTVGMARPGKKLENFRQLAATLERIANLDWRLEVVGGGAAGEEARAAFGGLGDRVTWHGERPRESLFEVLARADLFVWPGFEEAYGLSYLEAQAHGLPVVARDEGGVSSVVRHGETGLLTPHGDEAALADAIASLVQDPSRRDRMGEAAKRFALEERSMEVAARRLDALLQPLVARK